MNGKKNSIKPIKKNGVDSSSRLELNDPDDDFNLDYSRNEMSILKEDKNGLAEKDKMHLEKVNDTLNPNDRILEGLDDFEYMGIENEKTTYKKENPGSKLPITTAFESSKPQSSDKSLGKLASSRISRKNSNVKDGSHFSENGSHLNSASGSLPPINTKNPKEQVSIFSKQKLLKDAVFAVLEQTKKRQSKILSQNSLKPKSKSRSNITKINVFSAFDEENGGVPIKKSRGEKFLDDPRFQLCLLLVTFFSLFADDYKIIVTPMDVDLIWDATLYACIGIFAAEIIMASICKTGYFNSYFFYLDIVSTLSLFLDITLVKDAIIGFSDSNNSGFTKVGKLIRLIRLFRLVRISKIYKSLSAANNQDDKKETVGAPKKKGRKDSKVGRTLSEKATKTVIIMLFAIIILLPLFNSDFWIQPDLGVVGFWNELSHIMSFTKYTTKVTDYKALQYNSADANPDATSEQKMLAFTTQKNMAAFESESLGKLLVIVIDQSSVAYYRDKEYLNLRSEEINTWTCNTPAGKVEIIQKDRDDSVLGAWLNIIHTFFICFLLIGGSSQFSRSTYNLIISPIERMIEKVVKVIEKPQKVKDMAFIEAEEEEYLAMIKAEGSYPSELEDDFKKKEERSMETNIIEESIKKVSILLGVGLGEAGSSLINNYLNKVDETDAMMKGQMIKAIFGFCDIRNFTDATEVLQQEVMVFVNTIADIIHTITDRYVGTANKNIGDAFLLVWKCPEKLKYLIDDGYITKESVFTNLADLSLFAFFKMYAEINRAFDLIKYVQNQGLKDRIGLGYKIKLGYGLHYGWAIEGAIGSHFKVDVSYLSPNVNVAGNLEAMTKAYGVPMLVSGEFYDILSDEVKIYWRKVDIIEPSVEGGKPFRLYAPLISDKATKFPIFRPLKKHILKTKDWYVFKKTLLKEMKKGFIVGPHLFQNDVDIALVYEAVNEEFTTYFNLAMEYFEAAGWAKAIDYFNKALTIDPLDAPTKRLLKYMKQFDNEVPHDWRGYWEKEDAH